MATIEEIKSNVLKLQNAGAPVNDIEEYVRLATSEIASPATTSPSIQTQPLTGQPIEQKAGSIISPSGLAQALKPRPEDIPELAATLGMGALTAARSTPVTAGLTGLAAAGAEGFKQLGQRAELLQGTPPETSTQALKQMGGAFARGAGAAVLGKTVDWARSFFGKQIPEAVYNSFLGTSQLQAESSIGKGAETLGEKVASLPLFEGMTGTRMSVLNKSKAGISFVEDKIQDQIHKAVSKNPNISVNAIDVASSLDDLIKSYSSTGTNQKEVKQLLKIQNEFLTQQGENIPLLKANELKRTFYKIINDRAFLKTIESNPVKVQAERTLSSSLRDQIAQKVPTLNELNARQGFLIGIRDNLIKSVGKETRTIPQAIAGQFIEPVATAGARISRLAGMTAEKLPLQTGTLAASELLSQKLSNKLPLVNKRNQ